MTEPAMPLEFPARLLPAAVRAWLGPVRLRLVGELFRFGVVGTVGFLVDAGMLTAAIALGLGPWLGRVASYLIAATTTYTLNRAWTFRHRQGGEASAAQWGRFVVVNLGGFATNYGTYALLMVTVPLVAAHPVLGVAAGSIAGLGVNFGLARRFVFTETPRRDP